uniref:Uncharacterized protein n=1 Tax=Rhizobium phage LG08 TaxID=3129229 RepID=A0AAU8HXQ7_9CAUD
MDYQYHKLFSKRTLKGLLVNNYIQTLTSNLGFRHVGRFAVRTGLQDQTLVH